MTNILQVPNLERGIARACAYLEERGVPPLPKWQRHDLARRFTEFLDRDVFLARLEDFRVTAARRGDVPTKDMLLEAAARFYGVRDWNHLAASALPQISDLPANLYKWPRSDERPHPFGLADGQMNGAYTRDRLFHNANWYNRNGERIGFGDLAVSDIANISEGLAAGAIFVVLSERDAAQIPDRLGGSVDYDAPGPEYLAEWFQVIIGRRSVAIGPNSFGTIPTEHIGRHARVHRLAIDEARGLLGLRTRAAVP